jgi:hypothetical protein
LARVVFFSLGRVSAVDPAEPAAPHAAADEELDQLDRHAAGPEPEQKRFPSGGHFFRKARGKPYKTFNVEQN